MFEHPFWQYSGLVLWGIIIVYALIWLIYGKRWVLKLGSSVILGSDLKTSIKKLVKELREKNVQDETLSNVAVYIFWRFTRVGIIGIILAGLPIWLLMQQNSLLKSQNDLLDTQNYRLNMQNNLIEADRRSSLIFLMSNILDKVDEEIRIQKTSVKGNNDNMKFRLSQSLIGRIVALSRAFQPYKRLAGDTLSEKLVSSERGQLFIALIESKLDSTSYEKIFSSGDFSYATIGKLDMGGADLTGANLQGAYLSGTYFHNANLTGVNLKGADLSQTDFSNANLFGADLSAAKLNNSDFRGADCTETDFQETNLQASFLNGANLKFANLKFANLSEASFSGRYNIAATTVPDQVSSITKERYTFSSIGGVQRSKEMVKNLTLEQLLSLRSLFESHNLDPQLEDTLKIQKPCLFMEEGCP